MSNQSAKKERSQKLVAQNQKLAAAAKLLKNAGLKGSAPDLWKVIREREAGKNDAAILANIKAKQNANNATRKAAKNAAKSAKSATKAATVKNKPANATGNAAPKEKSNAKVAAATAQKNLGAKFAAQGLKFYPAAVKYFTEQKKAGKNEATIFEEIKARNNLKAAPVRTKKNTGAAKANNVAPVPVMGATVANKGAVKGQYICEKCRFVANNTTRKNNNKKNNAVNYTYNEQGY